MNGTRLPEQVAGAPLLLRLWTPDDLGALGALVSRNLEHLRPWMPWVGAEPLTDEERAAQIERWRAEWADGGDAFYGVFLGGAPVGGTGLHRRRGPHGLEIGYWVDLAHCGRGLATRTARLLTTAGLAVPGIDFVEIHHDKANLASAGVPRKLGYAFLGETPDQVEAPGEIGVDCAWRMTAADWPG